MIKFLGLFVFLTLLGYLYDRYKFKYEGDEELNRYEKMKEYLLNDSASGLMAKPILWIHNDKEVNSRKWLSFGGRNSARTNLEYLTTCLETIVKKNGDSFNVCLIDDTSFEKLIPDWHIKLHKLSDPVKSHIRTLALTKILHYYGGLLVPNSLILKKPLINMFNSGVSKTGMFSVEYYNKTNTSDYTELFPSARFMGCKKNNKAMRELSIYIEKLTSIDNTNESDFLGQINRYLFKLSQEHKVNIVNGSIIGVRNAHGCVIRLDDLFEEERPNFGENMIGIYIDKDELLKRKKYSWFVNMRRDEILKSNSFIGKYVLTCQDI